MLNFYKFLLISLLFLAIGSGIYLTVMSGKHTGAKKDELLIGGSVLLVVFISLFLFLWVLGFIKFRDLINYFKFYFIFLNK